jgi:hypothetical protein
MKRFIALALVLMFIVAATGYAEEVFAPGRHNTGKIGTSSKYWANGYFTTLANARVEVASKDYGTASNTAWTLSAAEQRAGILFVSNGGSTGNTIVAPAETGRIYHVFNRSGYPVTIKKSGGTGVTLANNSSAIVGYFQIGAVASTDYYVLASAAFSY